MGGRRTHDPASYRYRITQKERREKKERERKFMVLKGLDISNWQKNINLDAVNFDFMIAKATEGVDFVDKFCDGFIQKAKAKGKLYGFYHFARTENDPIREADYFVDNCSGYFGEGLPILDWEPKQAGNVNWALLWLKRVEERTKIKPMIYMNESTENSYDWTPVVENDNGLWIAKYSQNKPRVVHFKGYAMWQYTSTGRLDGYGGDLDLNEFYGDEAAWRAYCGNKSEVTPAPQPQPEPQPEPEQTVETTTSSNVYIVQSGDTLSGIATKYGTNWQELARVNGLKNPDLIYPGQKINIGKQVEQFTQEVYYTVQSGDTLSGIASKYGTTWQNLQAMNGIQNPNLIYAGQKIRVK